MPKTRGQQENPDWKRDRGGSALSSQHGAPGHEGPLRAHGLGHGSVELCAGQVMGANYGVPRSVYGKPGNFW